MADQIETATREALRGESFTQEQGNEALWSQIFTKGHPDLVKQQTFHKKLPSEPRCKLCYVPFGGIGGWIMRWRGKARNSRNPNFCNACDGFIKAYPGGADVEMSVLYVDIRQSTQYADSASPASVSRRINTFLNQVTEIITEADGFVSAFYGDCVVAVWPPGFCGPEHARKCLEAARQLGQLRMLDADGKPIPVGVAAHTGTVFIGTVAAMQGSFRDVSIFGRNVNVVARLAATAAPSEVLVTGEILRAAGEDTTNKSSRALQLKGITEPVAAYSLT